MATIEAVVLTGGASTRMGSDKASLRVDGEGLAHRVARLLQEAGYPVTICGVEPIEGFAFHADAEPNRGPLAAIAGFEPHAPHAFVASCDMPAFDPRVVEALLASIGDADAAVPLVAGRLQPLAALYASRCFGVARDALREGKSSMMALLDRLDVRRVEELALAAFGLDLASLSGANTPAELVELTTPRAPGLTGYFRALLQVLEHAPRTMNETVPLERLAGRVLCEPVRALRDHPAFHASAVDGFALTADDWEAAVERPVLVRLVDSVAAGTPGGPPLTTGQAVRIMTGAPLPPGAAGVVMQELAALEGDQVRLGPIGVPKSNIRRRGEEFYAGDVIVAAGVVANASVVAAAAMTGQSEWHVGVPPKVAILVTGDEVQSAGETLRDAAVFDSHSPTLAASLRAIGIEPAWSGRCGDSADATAKALEEALADADVLFTTGGASGGERDYVRSALLAAGFAEVFAGVRIKPGRPVIFATRGGDRPRYAFGLPGNPMAAQVAFTVIAKPFLLEAAGLARAKPEFWPARLAEPLISRRGVTEFVPVSLTPEGSHVLARPLGGRRSHMFGALANANGLVMLSEATNEVAAGTIVPAMRWP